MSEPVVDIHTLQQDNHNFNKGTTAGKQLIEKSFRELGAGRSILLDKDGRIIAGNKSQLAAIEAGITKVRVIETTGDELVAVKRTDVSLDDKKGRELALADNVTTQINLSWDQAELAAVGEDIPELNVADWGLDPKDLGIEQPTEQKDVQEDDFDETQDHIEPICQKGDIYQLGNHRLMCGDSTSASDFALLMDLHKADIAFTSPPYGVNDGSLRKHQEKGHSDHTVKNFYLEHDDNMKTWHSLVEETWQRMHEYSEQQFINIEMLSDNKRELLQWVARHAENFVDMIIWDKVHGIPNIQPNVLNNKFENIFIFGDKNASRKLKYGNFRGNTDNMFEIKVGNNEYSDVHKAVFPVALPAKILEINSNAQSVLDCFGGTGTTLIAAEQLGRKCYMMELDPHYCDIIIARWEKLTGNKATKL